MNTKAKYADYIESVRTIKYLFDFLKGTNTKERISASKAILEYLVNYNCFTIVATHDIELSDNDSYEKYYFDCNVLDNDISFDYIIKKGICTTTNAIALLKLLDYPKDIVNNSMKYVKE